MRITAIEIIPLRLPLPRVYKGSTEYPLGLVRYRVT